MECRCLSLPGQQCAVLYKEFHVDGFRYDEVSTLLSTNQGNGWQFCRDLTTQLRNLQNRILQNAEFWPGRFDDIPSTAQPIIAPASAGGAGFDVVQHDYLRRTLRDAIGAASGGASASISVTGITDALILLVSTMHGGRLPA